MSEQDRDDLEVQSDVHAGKFVIEHLIGEFEDFFSSLTNK